MIMTDAMTYKKHTAVADTLIYKTIRLWWLLNMENHMIMTDAMTYKKHTAVADALIYENIRLWLMP